MNKTQPFIRSRILILGLLLTGLFLRLDNLAPTAQADPNVYAVTPDGAGPGTQSAPRDLPTALSLRPRNPAYGSGLYSDDATPHPGPGETSLEACAVEPWPAEAVPVLLTALDDDLRIDLSGAHWNSETRTLWIVRTGRFWALVEDGADSFAVAERDGQRGEWLLGGDLEGITQVELDQDVVYVLVENTGEIKAVSTAVYGTATVLRTWSLSAYIPPYAAGLGPEGLTFVPDVWLARNGFVDPAGNPYISTLGMGGLMFVAHQREGYLYVFDLDPNSTEVVFVGQYATARTESSGLEFDRSAGWLYISHNTGGNTLEVNDLTSTPWSAGIRELHAVVEYQAPYTTNLEGFALASGDEWCFYTEDHEIGEPRQEYSLQWYQECSGTPLAVKVQSLAGHASGFNPAGVLALGGLLAVGALIAMGLRSR